ncbi:MAG: HPr family phosphocarrier protein [Oscillospiraceae bacterium]
MKACLIRLGSVDEVKQFIRIVSQVPYEVRVTGGPRTVNAKSEMDVFSLNLTRPLELQCPDADAQLYEQLAPFLITRRGGA